MNKKTLAVCNILFSGALLLGCNSTATDSENSQRQTTSGVAESRDSSSDASAPGGAGQSNFLSGLVRHSDLVFKGTLEAINYRNSAENIPHTFARYKIDEIVKGEYSGDTITLRFVGGYFDEADIANSNHLTVSNSPELALEETSVLMVGVDAGVDTGCPLILCEEGRFKIENGNVIAANESAVIVDDKGGVDYISKAARDSGAYKASLAAMNAEKFVAHLKRLASRDDASNKARSGKAVTDIADINAPFHAAKILTTASEAPVVDDAATKNHVSQSDENDFDRWEREQLRQNGGNPVLGLH